MSLNDDSVTAGIRVSSNHPDRYQTPIAPTRSEFFHDVTTSFPVDRLDSSKYSLQGRVRLRTSMMTAVGPRVRAVGDDCA